MDEAEKVAEAVGVAEQYRKMAETGEMNFEQIEKYLSLLHDKSESWIAKYVGKAEPFIGSRETVHYLKEMGYETAIVTDDALMSLQECNRIVREKLGVDEIIPTAKIVYDGEKIRSGLKNKRKKQEILKGLIAQHEPQKLLCMVQGKNDYCMALSARRNDAIVISVNSHSPKLESVSNYHIDTIAAAPALLEEILK